MLNLPRLIITLVPLLTAPLVAFGAYTIQEVIGVFQDILGVLIPLIIGIGVLIFLWGVVKFVTAGESDEQKKAARNLMIYGIIAIFVMVAVWGLVTILTETFGITEEETPLVPRAPQ